MEKEFGTLIYSMINNIIIAIIKVAGGMLFGLSSLFADGLHTFSDFITDIVSLVGTKISEKKPTKHHPFGFGRVEYLTNLFIGIILLVLGIYIISNSFGKEHVIPSLSLLWLLLATIILKGVCILEMIRKGKQIKSKVLLTSAEESKADLYSTIGVGIITIVLQFSDKYPMLRYIDLIGSILIGVIVLKTAKEIICSNSLALIGEIEEDEEEINRVKEFLNKFHEIKREDIYLIKYGGYFKLQLGIKLDENMNLKKIMSLEKNIKRKIIRNKKFNIRYVTITVLEK